jgi:hypothetical protein
MSEKRKEKITDPMTRSRAVKYTYVTGSKFKATMAQVMKKTPLT